MASPLLRQKVVDLTEERLKTEENEHLLDSTSPTYLADREKRRHEITSQLLDITADMLDKMVCKMESKTYIRSAFYGATQLLTRAYNAVHVSDSEVKRLQEVATSAAKKKQSILFLPRHTSHVDYVTLQVVCYRLGLTLPVVVAGDNLNFPIVGGFLQSCGAMWIRRSFANDQLYTALVQAYLDTMLQQGYNLECFIEGGRSRTGKLLSPKFGFLSFVLDSILAGRTEDVWICPVSLQYDKVIEVDSYVNELLGKPKQKEDLAGFLSASSVLSLNLGRIDCRFHEPWSLKDFISEQQARQTLGADFSAGSNSRIRLLRTLGYRVLSDINEASVVMPTALVGTVLLTIRGRGIGKSELARRVDWLAKRIRLKGGKVADFKGMPTSHVVERALDVLGPKLVGTVDGLAEETFYAIDRFQLSFYRNMTIHLFISEALIAAALYSRVKQGGGSANERMTEAELIDKVTFLSQLFRGEFIFTAGQGLQHNLEDAVQGLVRDDVLTTSVDGETMVGLSDSERKSGRESYDLYCFLIWPFVDAAWLGAVSLLALAPSTDTSAGWVEMQKAQDMAHFAGRTLYHQGDLSYFEAVNKEALRNSYSRFQEEGIIQVAKATDPKNKPTVRLAPEWRPERDAVSNELKPSGRLWEFIENIAQFRREGKNRRDEAAVSTRVLSLAAKLNQQIFAEELQIPAEAQPDSVKESRRRSKL
ncbi:hypothetical protein H2200_003221 [Cladophialophora chaetospira]|uniref:Phospholipid/glycerol acyltransferase domain-containing protein n=1 Tax=Cladophialophora chaetospira TaxID=386627 RepID=A0AA39CL87_9EURO|nr:hypothetical protein H2200_003221 [Cladophialophora chaetospira]